MKRFYDYIVESEKTYEFRIRVAGVLPLGFEDMLERALKKYELTSFTSGKKSPIQETPTLFGNLQNVEVTTWDASVKYPVTSSVLKNYLIDSCSFHASHMLVHNTHEPIEEIIASMSNQNKKAYEPLITKTEMEQSCPKAQSHVGASRVMDLLKDLEQARKERTNNPGQGGPTGKSEDINPAQNNKSVIGS